VKAKTTEVLNSLTEHDLRNCFEHWQHRVWTQEGDYFEGDGRWLLEFVKEKELQAESLFWVGPRILDYCHQDIGALSDYRNWFFPCVFLSCKANARV
jgi:hypothetical protein